MTSTCFQRGGAAAVRRQLLLALIGSTAVGAAASAQLRGGSIGNVAADKPRVAAAPAAKASAASASASAARTPPAR
jgi:hypothetical protein